MDPLSVAASVAGLVTLADLVFRTATKYRKDVKDARKEVDSLLAEIKNTSLLLHNLSFIAFELESSATADGKSAPSLQLHHLYDCKKILRRLEQGLSDGKKKMEKPLALEGFKLDSAGRSPLPI